MPKRLPFSNVAFFPLPRFSARLGLISCVTSTYWNVTEECGEDAVPVRIYLVGTIVLISVNILLLVILVNRSAQGSITEVHKRRLVAPLLVIK